MEARLKFVKLQTSSLEKELEMKEEQGLKMEVLKEEHALKTRVLKAKMKYYKQKSILDIKYLRKIMC